VEIANVPYILLDKFRLERKIGAGGMGVVYRATDLTLKRTVAVKTLPTVSPEHAIQLRREARAMASVSHPNLALIFGAETWRGQPLLIVEYMNAGTLADRLEFGAMSGPEAVKFGLQMAAVLDHLHAADILHRDIKPSNIGFVAPDIPKLLDFGLAQLLTDPRSIRRAGLEDATTTSTERTVSDYKPGLAGTPAYMSPEVVNGADPDPSVDLWALAMVIYESISLTNPMRKGTVGLTLKEVAAARVPDVRTKAVSCPADIAELLAAALSADIRRRPKTAKDFQRRLESCLSVTA
jgi:serine/threonine protein kinase